MFSLILVDTEYRFIRLDVGANRLSSNAQIFNYHKLKRKIEDSTWDFCHLNLQWERGPSLHDFLLGGDSILKPWLMNHTVSYS